MSEKSLNNLSDDVLLQMASPSSGSDDIPEMDDQGMTSFSNDFLLDVAQQRLANSIDTKSGADAGVRAQVAGSSRPDDKLKTLQKFYPDAVPVEIFDPKYGATKFGRGNFVFTNPESGQLTLFDEDIRLFGIPVPTLGDFADVGPEIAEVVGGVAGGTLAAAAAGTATAPTVIGAIPAATAAFVAGEGLGSATAREAYIGVLDYFGETEDNRTGLERFGDFSTTAALNAAAGPITSKLLDGVKFVAGAPIRYVAKSMSVPAREAYERMVGAGVSNPTVGQTTGSPLANLFENAVLANLPTSTNTMRKNAQQTLAELDAAVRSLAEKYGGTRTTSEAAEKVMSSAQKARVRYDEKVNEMYTEVGRLIPEGLTSPAKSTIAFTQKYLADSKTATGADDIAPALRQAEKLLQDAKDGLLNYDRLKDFRSSLIATVRKAESQGALSKSEQRVKELIGYVSNDLDSLVASAAPSKILGSTPPSPANDILAKYKAANDFVLQNQKKGGDIAFVDDVIKRGESLSTNALKAVLSGSKEGGEQLEKLRRQFTADEFEVLSGYMLGKMGTPNFSAQGISEVGENIGKEGVEAIADAGFSPARFITNWNSLSKESKEALFSGTEYKNLVPALDDLVFTIDRVGKAAQDMANPSGTARALYAMGVFGVMGGDTMLGKMAGSDGFEYGLGSLIGPYASAKLMTNKDFVQWVSGAVEKSVFNPKSFGQHVRRLGQIAEVNPDIRDEVRGVLQGLTQESIEPLSTEGSSSAPKPAPEDNELGFRSVVPKSTADKLLPNREELLATVDNFSVPQVGPASEDMFEEVDVAQASMPSSAAMSPSILPSEKDREIAMRRGNLGGIASLV